MVVNNLETVRIDKLLEEARAEEKDLKIRLSNVQSKIKSLSETRALLRGEDSQQKSIPDALEEILHKRGKAHVDELVEILKTEYHHLSSVAKQTVSGALIRYANQGKRFERVGKNTFALLGNKQGGDM